MTFIYKAKHGPGKTVEGELDVDSRAAAVSALDTMGYSPVWIKEKGVGDRDEGKRRLSRRRISRRDVTLFTRQLGSLTKSGVPILKSLSTIGDQAENAHFSRVVKDIQNTVQDGNMLSGGLERHPDLFSNLYVNMIKAGESGGVLENILFRLADTREKEDDTTRKVQSAIAYPLLVVSVGVITVFVLLSFFLPKIIDLFDDFKDLPLPTRMLIGVSEFFSGYWYWMLILVCLFVVVMRALATKEGGRTFFDRIKLHLPVIGRFVQQSEIVRFTRTLALLIDAGIPIDKSLELSANTLHNTVLKQEIDKVTDSTVRQGAPFSSGLKKCQYFPALVANMCAVGEESGRLDESLNEVAFFYEKEIDQSTKMATTLLEPILILVVGGIVGFIVAAMLLPIFQVGRGL